MTKNFVEYFDLLRSVKTKIFSIFHKNGKSPLVASMGVNIFNQNLVSVIYAKNLRIPCNLSKNVKYVKGGGACAFYLDYFSLSTICQLMLVEMIALYLGDEMKQKLICT